jgi:hypothetical protein
MTEEIRKLNAVGTVAVLRLQPEYSHLVATVRSPTWQRYSIATHYSRVEQ